MKKICLLVLFSITSIFGFSDSTNVNPKQTKHFLFKDGSDSIRIGYLVYLPDGYESGKENWPMIMFLHGGGERGDNPDILRTHGLPKLIENGKKLPFVVVSPQCFANQYWSFENLEILLDTLIEKYRIDSLRIYLTGLSMGGGGTWELAMRQPNKFAAIAPLCGWGDTTRVAVLKDMSIWAFHGEKDDRVPVQRTEELVNILKKINSNIKFTKYSDLGHSIWRETYNSDLLYDWFLQQKKK